VDEIRYSLCSRFPSRFPLWARSRSCPAKVEKVAVPEALAETDPQTPRRTGALL